MKRRSFIQSLLAIPVVAAVVKIASAKAAPPSFFDRPRPLDPWHQDWQMAHKGFALRWSGWIGDINRPRYCGHWVGVNKETDTLIYASYPGKEGEFKRGDAFDITMVSPQIDITIETSEALRAGAQSECLQRIIRVIDDWRPGLTTSGHQQNSYAQFKAAAPIRKGDMVSRTLSSRTTVVPLNDERQKFVGLFAGVAMHDAMVDDMVKVMTEGEAKVNFQ